MVESEADGLNEEIMLGAVMFGHAEMQAAIKAINELAAGSRQGEVVLVAPEPNTALKDAVGALAEKSLAAAYALTEKQQRHAKIGEDQDRDARGADQGRLAEIHRGTCRQRILQPRIPAGARRESWKDTRGSTAATPRPCAASTSAPACWREPTVRRCSLAAKPRRWWSRLWAPDAMRRSSTASRANAKKPFMLHYNFPPFSVGETGMMGSPKRARDRPR